MRRRAAYVYILASGKNGTLYVGVTNNLERRIHEHQTQKKGFTARYQVFRLVYYDVFPSFYEAIAFEKRLKRWQRSYKITLIEKTNPTWQDLREGWSIT